MLRHKWLLTLSLSGIGCVEEAPVQTVPEQIIPMQIATTRAELLPGESTTLRVTITNTLETLVRLFFPSSCQAEVYIRNPSGRVVTPDGGTYECAAVPSLVTLAAGQAATFDFVWSGETEFGLPGTATRLPPGSYYASAEMHADGYTAIAFPILIVLH
jgi:hypothetical protein